MRNAAGALVRPRPPFRHFILFRLHYQIDSRRHIEKQSRRQRTSPSNARIDDIMIVMRMNIFLRVTIFRYSFFCILEYLEMRRAYSGDIFNMACMALKIRLPQPRHGRRLTFH